MKKTALVIFAAAAVSAVAGGLTALGVSRYMSGEDVFSSTDHAALWSDATPKAGNHFTAYQADQYPDLTYAAENAVKAVVNIESIREVQYGGGRSRGYDPFYEFFGIPYGGGGYSEPQTREQRSGGSGVIISADGMLFCYSERTGAVALVKPTEEKFEVVSQFRVTKGDGPHWAHPIISNGVMYLRHGNALLAYKIK